MKTCDGCKALTDVREYGHRYRCGLEYQIEEIEVRQERGTFYRAIPAEMCPKPRTWRAWMNTEMKGQSDAED